MSTYDSVSRLEGRLAPSPPVETVVQNHSRHRAAWSCCCRMEAATCFACAASLGFLRARVAIRSSARARLRSVCGVCWQKIQLIPWGFRPSRPSGEGFISSARAGLFRILCRRAHWSRRVVPWRRPEPRKGPSAVHGMRPSGRRSNVLRAPEGHVPEAERSIGRRIVSSWRLLLWVGCRTVRPCPGWIWFGSHPCVARVLSVVVGRCRRSGIRNVTLNCSQT